MLGYRVSLADADIQGGWGGAGLWFNICQLGGQPSEMVLEAPSTPWPCSLLNTRVQATRTVSSISNIIRLSGRRLSLKAKVLGPEEPVLCRLQSCDLGQILYLPPYHGLVELSSVR